MHSKKFEVLKHQIFDIKVINKFENKYKKT